MRDDLDLTTARVGAILDTLPPLHVAVYQAVAVNGGDPTAVAVAHGIPAGRVQDIVLSVRRSLRAALEEK